MVKFLQIPKEVKEHVNLLAKAASTEHMMIDWQVPSFIQQSLAIEELEIQIIPKDAD